MLEDILEKLLGKVSKDATMKVAMIGFSRSGKTSYMAMMYDWFSKNSVEGFSISTKSSSAGNSLLSIAKDIKNGHYPPGTAIQDKYEFLLRYEGTDLTSFEWVDYRGGVLDAIINGVSQNFSQLDAYDELVKFVAKSSALIVFLDSTSFIGPQGADLEEQLRIVNALIQQVSASRSGDIHLPVSFVLTKLDKSVKKNGDLDRILESSAGETLMSILSDAANSKVIAALLTGTIVGPECLNISYPLLMSMCSALLEERGRAAKEFQVAKEEFERYIGKAGVWDDICSFFKDEITYRELARRRLEKAKESAEKHDRLIPALKKLYEVLESAAKDEHQFVHVF